MAKVAKLVITCDRHGGEITDSEQFLHIDVTPGGNTRGRKSHEKLDLCEDCSKDFLKFMEGLPTKKPKRGLTANQRVAEGMI